MFDFGDIRVFEPRRYKAPHIAWGTHILLGHRVKWRCGCSVNVDPRGRVTIVPLKSICPLHAEAWAESVMRG